MFWPNKRKIDFSWVSSDSRFSEKITLKETKPKLQDRHVHLPHCSSKKFTCNGSLQRAVSIFTAVCTKSRQYRVWEHKKSCAVGGVLQHSWEILLSCSFYGGPQGQNTSQYWAGYTTIFRDTKQFYTVHNNISWCKTIFHGAQQFFVIQNNSSRCTRIFGDAKQFFTVHNNFSRFKTIFHGEQQAFEKQNNFHSAQQAFEIENKFSRCTTNFRDAVDAYVEHNRVSQCKIKFHDAQQKFERLVTSTGNFISRDHTTACSLPSCFVNTRATQLTMAASLLPTGDEK